MKYRRETSALAAFVVLACSLLFAQSNPVPLINNPLVPASSVPGGPSFTLTINGTGFVSSSIVEWNGEPLATKFLSGSQLNATVPAANIATASTASITVVTPGSGVGTSNVGLFEIRQSFSAVSFSQSQVSTESYYPIWVLSYDLNGDGKQDLVSSDTTGITVFLGNGNGAFQPPAQYSVGMFPGQIIIGDFNSDGKLDLIVSVYTGYSLLIGNGDGTFQPYQEFDIGGPGYFAVADFNSDGKLDLAQGLVSGQIAILLGNGNGTFQSPIYYNAGSGGAYSVAAGDFNSDDKLDLSVAVYDDNAVSILLGNGDGTFQPGIEYASAAGPNGIVAADFNGDGNLDVAATTVNSAPPAISVLLGTGNGTFQAHVDYSTLQPAYGFAAQDLNGDNRVDLMVTNSMRQQISTFLGNGDGTFQKPASFDTGKGPLGMAFGDFNNDGLMDLATSDANGPSPTVSVLPQITSVLSATTIKFGNVKAGHSSPPVNVELSNIGNNPLIVKRITLSPGGELEFNETNNCPHSLPNGAGCTIAVVFSPTADGTFSAVVKVNGSATSTAQQISLHGTGVQ